MAEEFTLNSVLTQMKSFVDMLNERLKREESEVASEDDLAHLLECLDVSTESLQSILDSGKTLTLNPKLAKGILDISNNILTPTAKQVEDVAQQGGGVAAEASKALQNFQAFVEQYQENARKEPAKYKVEESPEGQAM